MLDLGASPAVKLLDPQRPSEGIGLQRVGCCRTGVFRGHVCSVPHDPHNMVPGRLLTYEAMGHVCTYAAGRHLDHSAGRSIFGSSLCFVRRPAVKLHCLLQARSLVVHCVSSMGVQTISPNKYPYILAPLQKSLISEVSTFGALHVQTYLNFFLRMFTRHSVCLVASCYRSPCCTAFFSHSEDCRDGLKQLSSSLAHFSEAGLENSCFLRGFIIGS